MRADFAKLQLSPEQTAFVDPLIRTARERIGPTGERRTFAPAVVFGEVDYPSFNAREPEKDIARAELRCGVVSAKAARKIRKVLQEEAPQHPIDSPAPHIPAHRVVAVDFETYFDKDYDVAKLGYHAYVHDARFNAYLVALWSDDGWHWVGHPKDAPWAEINGAVWLSHNAQFDRAVFFRLQELGIVPAGFAPIEWHCTAALAVYLAAPRALAGAARELVGVPLDKSTRAKARGDDGQSLFGQSPEMLAYALKDAEACCRIWMEHGDKWPTSERRLSAQTIHIGERGIQIDAAYVAASIERLEQARSNAAAQIPWARYAPPTSPKELAKACHAVGITPPTSTAEDSTEFDEWQEIHGTRFPWIEAMQTFRRANRKLKILQAALIRCRAGHEMTFSLKYFGGFTGRWSGGSGLNLQNLNKEKDFDVDIRRMLIPRPGHVFVICDLAQIEPRCLAYLSGNWPLLERIAAGESIYEAHARATMGWPGGPLKKENPRLYGLAKARCISEGTLVLTNHGYIPIEQVRDVDMVWDGDEWVHHQGVVCNGYAETINVAGERFTSDHLIFRSRDESTPAGRIPKGALATYLAWRKAPGSDWQDLWLLARAVGTSLSEAGLSLCALFMSRMRKGIRCRVEQSQIRQNTRLQSMRSAADEANQKSQSMGETD